MMESKILKSHSNKYQIHVARSYDYKLVSVGDNFSKLFKSYIAEDVVYNFINSMIEESKCYTDITKKIFYKKPVMTKQDDEDFESSTKCWIFDNDYADNDVKIRDFCHIT